MRILPALLTLALTSSTLFADEIVQSGSLSGGKGGPDAQPIELDRFDTQGGTRVLNSVRLDLLTSTSGGGTTTGSGVPVNIGVTLSADYLLGVQTLAETEAVIDLDIPNSGPPTAFSAFNTDTEEVVFDQPAELAPWIGTGQLTLTGVTEFHIVLTPPDEIDFSAGGTINYTVTYDFTNVAPVPTLPEWGGIALVVALGALGCGALRSRVPIADAPRAR